MIILALALLLLALGLVLTLSAQNLIKVYHGRLHFLRKRGVKKILKNKALPSIFKIISVFFIDFVHTFFHQSDYYLELDKKYQHSKLEIKSWPRLIIGLVFLIAAIVLFAFYLKNPYFSLP